MRLRNAFTVHCAKIRISALHFIHDIDNHYQNISYCCYLFLLRNDPQKRWGIMIEGCLHAIFPLYGAMALVFTSPLYAQDATSSDDELIVSATRTEGSRNDSPGH
jgi:hypothetical protein